MDGDAIPIYGEEHQEAPVFSGRRIHRGLYKTKTGRLINADLNGAANILRKHCPDAFSKKKDTLFLDNIIVRKYNDLNKRIPVKGIEAA